MERQRIIFSTDIVETLHDEQARLSPDRIFVLVDETTSDKCLPRLGADAARWLAITIPAGDQHKDIESLSYVWQQLQQLGASRHSLLVNLGGGMVTDLGGFAAATFKRGLHCINIPTTLLAMVDASVGGKTGVNFGGLKNEVGVFRNAASVIIDMAFLSTLDRANLLSGYAEMLKHGLLASPQMLAELLRFDVGVPQPSVLEQMVKDSVGVKQRVVLEDPTEQGMRKALNLGHTVGHAFESLALRRGRPVLHGYAVAWGLIAELYLSTLKTGFPVDILRQVTTFVNENYGHFDITCNDYPYLLELMAHDKKNTAGVINFSLLSDVGQLRLNQTASQKEIEEALDFFRDGM